jgi:asparagine synthase (glutamine-hydrolysing)
MWDSARQWCLVYNGEIYNYIEIRRDLEARGHRFRTKGDAEVLLEAFRAWGPAAVERFNGMFAFAIWNQETSELWLFRDRFGVKPLFYHCDGQRLLFASTCRAMARHLKLDANLEYVSRGLSYWVYEDDSEISPYSGIQSLPPGRSLHVRMRDGRIATRIHRYYDLASRVPSLAGTLADEPIDRLLDRLRDLLASAVELRLRADVPVAISLSGGLDSSTISALLAERHAKPIGFTYGHPAVRKSEGPLVDALCRQAGIGPVYVWPDGETVVRAFWDTLEAQDAPFPGLSIVAQNLVYQAAKARGIRVLVGGQGGDEAFMGYRKFQLFRLWRLLRARDLFQALAFSLSLLPALIAGVRITTNAGLVDASVARSGER